MMLWARVGVWVAAFEPVIFHHTAFVTMFLAAGAVELTFREFEENGGQ